jgi:Mlc titration factor MtfA (ptsG expression regulator)
MSSDLFLVLVLAIVTILVGIFAVIVRPVLRRARRRKLMEGKFPRAWERILSQNLPPYDHLSRELRQQLNGYTRIFLDEKRFEGCGGLELTDEMRVTIAAQACLLLLNRPATMYPRLKSVLVYPDTYVAQDDEAPVRLGESWSTGAVVLSWDDTRKGALNFDDGHNVAIHEFAHQLDQEDGSADGAPILSSRSAYRTWARVLSHGYADLQEKAERGKRSVMDDYGATNPAEFFAVATETFFEKPEQLNRKHSELYEELRDYYRLDPLTWS